MCTDDVSLDPPGYAPKMFLDVKGLQATVQTFAPRFTEEARLWWDQTLNDEETRKCLDCKECVQLTQEWQGQISIQTPQEEQM